MNKIAIVLFAIVALAAGRALLPNQAADATAETVRQDAAVNVDNFQYVYQTSNGINAQEQGQLKQIGKEAGIATQGEYSYVAPDGQTIRVTYIADENGFQPQGSHLPVAPAGPPAPAAAAGRFAVSANPPAPRPLGNRGQSSQRRSG